MGAFPNWHQQVKFIWPEGGKPGYEPIPLYVRDREGRSTWWDAKIEQIGSSWWSTVYRHTNVHPRRSLRLAFGFAEDIEQTADGRWEIGPFSSVDNAVLFTEAWIDTRRKPETWENGPHPLFPIGDRFLIQVEEADALRWVESQGYTVAGFP